jgi:hypothetical protein
VIGRSRGARVAVTATAYVAVWLVWVYAIYDREPDPPAAVFVAGVVILALAHLAAGYLLGFPSLALVPLMLLIALPAGARNGDEDGFPVVGAAILYWLWPALLLVLAGASARRFRAYTADSAAR